MSGSVIHRKRRWRQQGAGDFCRPTFDPYQDLGLTGRHYHNSFVRKSSRLSSVRVFSVGFGFSLMEKEAKKISFQLRFVTRLSVSPSVVSQTDIGPRSSFPGCESGHQTQWRPPVLTVISVSSLVSVSFPFSKHWSGARSCAGCWKGRQDYKTCLRPLISLPLNFSCGPNNDEFIQPSRSNHRHIGHARRCS